MGMTGFMTAAAVAAGIASLVVLVVAPRRRPAPTRLQPVDLLAAVGAIGVVLLVALAGVWAWGVDSRPFSAIHLAYLGVVVSIPMLGVGLGVVVARGWARPVVALAAVARLLPVPAGWSAPTPTPLRRR